MLAGLFAFLVWLHVDLYCRQRSNTNIKYHFLDIWLVGENKILECQIWLDAGQPAVWPVGSVDDWIISLFHPNFTRTENLITLGPKIKVKQVGLIGILFKTEFCLIFFKDGLFFYWELIWEMETDEWVPLLVNCPKSVSEGIDFVCVLGWGWEGWHCSVFLVILNTSPTACSPLVHFLLYFLIQIQLIIIGAGRKKIFFGLFFLIMKKIHRTKTKWPYLNHVELKPYFRLDRRFPWIQVKGPWQRACTNLKREGILLRR